MGERGSCRAGVGMVRQEPHPPELAPLALSKVAHSLGWHRIRLDFGFWMTQSLANGIANANNPTIRVTRILPRRWLPFQVLYSVEDMFQWRPEGAPVCAFDGSHSPATVANHRTIVGIGFESTPS